MMGMGGMMGGAMPPFKKKAAAPFDTSGMAEAGAERMDPKKKKAPAKKKAAAKKPPSMGKKVGTGQAAHPTFGRKNRKNC